MIFQVYLSRHAQSGLPRALSVEESVCRVLSEGEMVVVLVNLVNRSSHTQQIRAGDRIATVVYKVGATSDSYNYIKKAYYRAPVYCYSKLYCSYRVIMNHKAGLSRGILVDPVCRPSQP